MLLASKKVEVCIANVSVAFSVNPRAKIGGSDEKGLFCTRPKLREARKRKIFKPAENPTEMLAAQDKKVAEISDASTDVSIKPFKAHSKPA